MDLQLAGKRALVTGGSKGIGLAAARALAEEGVALVLVARGQAGLDAAAAELHTLGQARVETIAADLSREEEVERVAAACGRLDILVNNAGAIPPGDLLAVDNERWRAAWDLKVFGFISLTRRIYPALRAQRSGVVVNVIGAAGQHFPPDYITGATGNAALMAFTRALGRGSKADGVRVVGINPGSVATERMEMLMRHKAAETLGGAARWRELLAGLPFGRAAAPEEIGAAVAFLASPRSGYTNATILTIDGGA